MVQCNGALAGGGLRRPELAVEKAQATGYDVPTDLYPYLGLGVAVTSEADKASTSAGSEEGGAAFRYVGSLDKNPPLATFDIRDEVCLKVGGFKHGQVVRDASGGELIVIGVKRVDGAPRLWFQPKDLGRPGAGAFPEATAQALRAKFSPVSSSGAGRQLKKIVPEDYDVVEDTDGERLCLCRHCRLPLGDFQFDGAALAHGECLAELTLRGLRAETEAQEKKAAEAKKARRAEYDIGWKAERIPRSLALAKELTGSSELGLRCLALDGEGVARVMPTVEPAAAVNLEYLALAMQVRLLEGREPFFSLDPVDPADRNSMQEKRFEPAWLAGTSVGEVLFQADYELKQICMGDRQLPCLPSLLDGQGPWSQQEERGGRAARQWFVVRRAGVTVAQDGALVPHCELGVDARQLVPSERGYVDAARTDERDSMVRMAKAISEHFAEVAAALPAVAELVHLARATVLARYLLESGCRCDEATLARYALPRCPEGDRYSMEIPTLRTKQLASSVVKQGRELLMQKRHRSIHGGVDLGVKAEKVPTQVVHQPLLGPDAGPRPPLPLFHCAAAAS
mmetsp:Transcript_55092/g.172733  ORF Transcript_55092/g.172733 Transcript_55092/m.172733 type:complete len:568 (+) Transcript_55092:77-1780(+)